MEQRGKDKGLHRPEVFRCLRAGLPFVAPLLCATGLRQQGVVLLLRWMA